MKPLVLSLFSVLVFCLPCQAQDHWEDTAQKLMSLAGRMDERSRVSQAFARQDRAALEERMAALKQQIEADTRALASARADLNRISGKRAGLADRFERETTDITTLEGAYRSALRQTLSRFEQSAVAAMHPETGRALEALMAQEAFPGLEQLTRFTDLVFSEIRATGEVETGVAPVIRHDGRVEDTALVRAGGFFLGYREGRHSFFVLPQSQGPGLSVKAERAAARNLAAWLDGTGKTLPMDITLGTAIRAQEASQSLESWVASGGVLLYPIIGAGLVGAFFTLVKMLHLLALRRMGPKQKRRIFDGLGTSDSVPEQARTLLSKLRRCPAARVVEAGVVHGGRSLDALETTVEERIMEEQGRQERLLSVIGVLAAIAPLLGLLGTVTGMIDTFRTITIFGTGDPRMMSTGISEALITTQAGLGVAVPLLLAHHFLKRRVAVLVADMEECGMGLMARRVSDPSDRPGE